MKYKSELIKDIVDTRGHEKSSLHYESECIETWVAEASGAYPKLMDYQSEWLKYIISNPIGEFPYITLSNVTNATVENVVPYAYKSAILKGVTLVNVQPTNYIVGGSNPTFFISKIIPKTMIKPNTRYFLRLYNTHQSVVSAYFKPCVKNRVDLISSDNKCAVFTTKSEFADSDFNNNKIHFYSSSNLTLEDVKDTKVILCEYVDGMENWDIPYFEGMQSVKMPVLTTTGKNLLYDVEWEIDKRLLSDGRVGDYIGANASSYINVSNLDVITFSGFSKGAHCLYDKDKSIIGERTLSGNMTIDVSGVDYIRVTIDNTIDYSNPQMEAGSVATSYEPHKSNILTVNEDVELGSVGEVKDELNLLTGQLTKRTETRAYQEGDESNSEVITDMANTRYKLPEESIKTVDLSIVNQDGNVLIKIKPIEGTMYLKTNGEILKPTFTGEVPVEAITQNLASFINLEMEE